MWISAIFDRKQSDVDYLKTLIAKLSSYGYSSFTDEEKAFWNSGTSKGALNANDLNRIENNIKFISDELISYGMDNIISNRSSEWLISDILYSNDITRIINNFIIVSNATLEYLPDFTFNITSSDLSYEQLILLYQTKFDLTIENLNVIEEVLNLAHIGLHKNSHEVLSQFTHDYLKNYTQKELEGGMF